MPTPEEQRILDYLNKNVHDGKWGVQPRRPTYKNAMEAAGWVGFFIGVIVTMLIFNFEVIPNAMEEAVNEYKQEAGISQINK